MDGWRKQWLYYLQVSGVGRQAGEGDSRRVGHHGEERAIISVITPTVFIQTRIINKRLFGPVPHASLMHT